MIRRIIGIAFGGLFVALAAIGSVSPLPAEAAGPGTWTAATSMTVPRTQHAGVLLPNGRTFVVGGYTGAVPTGWVASAETYSPTTNTWSAAAPMPFAVPFPTAALLNDGRVLVGNSALPQIYNPAANSWSATGPMPIFGFGGNLVRLLDGRVLLANFAAPALYDPATNTWGLTGPTASVHELGGATLLANGKVLATGSDGPANGTDTMAELFDPATNLWSPAGITTGRVNSRQTLLPDGRVLVTGGMTELFAGFQTAVDIYDPVANTWSAGAPMATGRESHTLTLLGNGKVLATAGNGGCCLPLSSEVYDPAADTWTTADAVSSIRDGAFATLLSSGQMLISGGGTPATDTAESYDATAWRGVASPIAARQYHSATLLWNAKVLVAGGGSASAEAYDEATNTWSPAGTMSTPREGHAAARMNDGRVLVVGGSNGPNTGLNHLLTAEIYNPNTNSWSPAASPTLDHIGDSAVLLSDGRVLVYGGGTDTQPEIYNPAANSWSLGSFNPNAGLPGLAVRTSTGRVLTLDLATASVYTPATDTWQPTVYGVGPFAPGSATQLDGSTKIVAAGGGDLCPPAQFTSSPLVAVFDGTLETWTSAAPMATSRFAHTASALYNGRLLVAGGAHSTAFCLSGFTVALADAELYDAASNTWTSAGSMTTARQSHSATLLPSGNVLVVGGNDGVAVVPTSELYDTGLNTDTDSDGYNDGLELALGQHPWSHCKTMRADLTGDGLVNSGDQGKLASKFGQRPPPSRVDQNGDKILNSGDQGLLASVFNKSVLMCA